MFLVSYFCKHRTEDLPVAITDQNNKSLQEFIKSLNDYIGYQSGVGIYSQKANGYYTIKELPFIENNKLEENFMKMLDTRK